MLCCVNWIVFTDVSDIGNTFIFTVEQLRVNEQWLLDQMIHSNQRNESMKLIVFKPVKEFSTF